MRRGLAGATFLSLSACVGLSPHSDPSSITDAEIGIYKLGMHKGCSDQGISKGDDPVATKRYCDCALDVLNQSLSHEQWQQATFASQKKLDRDELGIIGPHMQQMKACKASG
jgi:hypothetical protein